MSSDLWSFSLATYARPGVEDACLQLQTAGANVCLLLCGLWLEQRGVSCDEQRVQQLQALTEPWDIEVVQPLRTLRMQWKARALDDAVLKGMREQVKVTGAGSRASVAVTAGGRGAGVDAKRARFNGLAGRMAGAAASPNRDALQVLRVAATST